MNKFFVEKPKNMIINLIISLNLIMWMSQKIPEENLILLRVDLLCHHPWMKA